jgi:hypothetical protein
MEPEENEEDSLPSERSFWMAKHQVERLRAKEYLLANPTATNKDVAASVGISQRTVGYARAELVNSGQIPPAWGDHKSAISKGAPIPKTTADAITTAAEGSPFDLQTTSDLNAAVETASRHTPKKSRLAMKSYLDDAEFDTDEIDFAKLKRILWRIARSDPDSRIRTSAIWTLTRIQQDVDERPLGPGIPRTKANIIDRLCQLFDGVGPAIVIEAMQTYLEKRKGTGNARDLPVDAPESAQTSSGGTSAPAGAPIV